jgi:hypothetical protein
VSLLSPIKLGVSLFEAERASVSHCVGPGVYARRRPDNSNVGTGSRSVGSVMVWWGLFGVSLGVFGRVKRPVDGMVRCGQCASSCENFGCVVLVGQSYSVFGVVSKLSWQKKRGEQ